MTEDALTIAKEVLGNRLKSVFNLCDPQTFRCYLLDGVEATRQQVIEAANRCLLSKGGEPIKEGR